MEFLISTPVINAPILVQPRRHVDLIRGKRRFITSRCTKELLITTPIINGPILVRPRRHVDLIRGKLNVIVLKGYELAPRE